MFRNVVKGRPRYADYIRLNPLKTATMGKLSDEDVVVAEALSDIEASLETKPKGSWFARAWGTSELDVIERKYVRKVDLYLL
jgi:hypothetical protein